MVYNNDLKDGLIKKGIQPSINRILSGKFEGHDLNRQGITDWYDPDVFMNLFDAS